MLRNALLILLLSLVPVALDARAPVPKVRAPELSAEALVGIWKYAWAHWEDGEITFYRDGTYRSSHTLNGPHYIGFWYVRGNTVTIEEHGYKPETNEVLAGPQRYTFTLERVGSGWAGRASSGAAVVLSKETQP